MSNVFTLDSLREEADKEYAPLKLEIGGDEIVLQNLIRLPEKQRNAVVDLVQRVTERSDDDSGLESVKTISADLASFLKLVTADGKGEKLLAAIGDDVALQLLLLNRWQEATQAGEASRSQS